MTKSNLYRVALEALNMVGARSRIRNQFNSVAAHTTDQRLRALVEKVIRDFDSSSTHTSHTPAMEMGACRVSAPALEDYCRENLDCADGDQGQ